MEKLLQLLDSVGLLNLYKQATFSQKPITDTQVSLNKNTFSIDFYFNLCYTYNMKITEKQINDFVEANDMIALGGDMFEDAGGHVWHESNIEDEIKEQNK